jgi:hypothetical protein
MHDIGRKYRKGLIDNLKHKVDKLTEKVGKIERRKKKKKRKKEKKVYIGKSEE